MIKIAFCDDDISVLDELNELMKQYCAEHIREMVCSAFHSPLELLTEIEKGVRFDILFLDVIMPGQNGINVAKEIRQYDDMAKIIFLTSSSEFAVESYAVNAYFYLIKPVCADKVFQLLDSVISECEKMQQYSLVLRCKEGLTRINLGKLIYCEVVGRTLLFHLENDKIPESHGSMDELCSNLAAEGRYS